MEDQLICRLNGQEILSSDIDSIANAAVYEAATTDPLWAYRDVGDFLYKWVRIFNDRFFDNLLPQSVLTFEPTRRRVLGFYQPGRNSHGHKFQINLNTKHLDRSEADLLHTLLHEMIHQHQDIRGTACAGKYHGKAFQDKAASFGLKVDIRTGSKVGPPGDPFSTLVEEYGVSFEPRKSTTQNLQPKQEQPRLRRWSCQCKSVWCGGDLKAACINCEQLFLLNPT